MILNRYLENLFSDGRNRTWIELRKVVSLTTELQTLHYGNKFKYLILDSDL